MVDVLTMVYEQLLIPLVRVVIWLVLAIAIMIIFWLIGKLVKRIVVQILQSFGVDAWVEEHKITSAVGNKKVSDILGSLAKWYFIVLGLAVVVGSPNFFGSFFGIELQPLPGLSDFLWGLANYLPVALGGILFFVLALLFARYIANQIRELHHKLKNIAAFTVEAVIVLFAAIIGLQMVLGSAVAQTIIQLLQIFVQPFIMALAIVFGVVVGLSSGLAFKDEIVKFAREVKREYM
ncbi:MAG TPA: hypothetical protein VI977_02440 [archaeon]|nr:hypothetical protein [archaeon]